MKARQHAVPSVDQTSKRELARRMSELDSRRQAQIGRQIDSINRLMADAESPAPQRYEHEMLALNEALAAADVLHQQWVDAVRAMHNNLADYVKEHSALPNGTRAFMNAIRHGMAELLGVVEEVPSPHGSTEDQHSSAEAPDSSGNDTA